MNDDCDNVLNQNQLDPNRVVIYERIVPHNKNMSKIEHIIGMLTMDGTRYHQYCDFNTFLKETIDIPKKEDGWENVTSKRNTDNICNLQKKLFVPSDHKISDNYPGYKLYQTRDNGGISFFVFIKDLDVFVQGRPTNHVESNKGCDDAEYIMTQLIKHYKPLQIFIGKSELNKMTEFSESYGPEWDGNSILLKIKEDSGKYTYAMIGCSIYEFETDEPIIDFVSSVGNNCVPYPYAVSENYAYSLGLGPSDINKSKLSYHSDRFERGYVCYKKDVKYEKLDVVVIAERNCDQLPSAPSAEIDSGVVVLIKDTNARMIGGCSSELELLNKKDICVII